MKSKRPHKILGAVAAFLAAGAVASVSYGPEAYSVVPAEYSNQPGPRLFFQHDCVSCHTVSSLKGANGTLGPGLDDVAVRADELSPSDGGRSYLRESILEPRKVIREGFADAMPSFAGKLNDSEVSELVEWLLTLHKDDVGKPLKE